MCDCYDARLNRALRERDELKRQNKELAARVRSLKEQNVKLAEQKREMLNRIMNDKLRNDRKERQREKANAGYLQVTDRKIVYVKD